MRNFCQCRYYSTTSAMTVRASALNLLSWLQVQKCSTSYIASTVMEKHHAGRPPTSRSQSRKSLILDLCCVARGGAALTNRLFGGTVGSVLWSRVVVPMCPFDLNLNAAGKG